MSFLNSSVELISIYDYMTLTLNVRFQQCSVGLYVHAWFAE